MFGEMDVTFDISRLIQFLDDSWVPRLLGARHVPAEQVAMELRESAIDTLHKLLEAALVPTLKETPLLVARRHYSDDEMRKITAGWEDRFKFNRRHMTRSLNTGLAIQGHSARAAA